MLKITNSSSANTVKFICSYGGKIIPRPSDGLLRYVGGEIRILSVDRSISVTDLLLKFGELCGSSVSLRCQLPKEDLDTLISVTSNEELAIIIEEYDRASQAGYAQLKIKVFLSPPISIKKISPPATYRNICPPSTYTSICPPVWIPNFFSTSIHGNNLMSPLFQPIHH